MNESDLRSPRKRPRDQLSLVVTARDLPQRVQRDGGDDVRLAQHRADRFVLPHPIRDEPRQRPAIAVLDLVDQFPEGPVEQSEARDAIVMRLALPAAKLARRIVLRNGLPAGWAYRRGFERV